MSAWKYMSALRDIYIMSAIADMINPLVPALLRTGSEQL